MVFGKASWAGTPSLDLATLDGTNGFRLIGIDALRSERLLGLLGGGRERRRLRRPDRRGARAEYRLMAESEGESYVVFGKASWAGTPSLDLATLDGTNGFRLIGIDAGD